MDDQLRDIEAALLDMRLTMVRCQIELDRIHRQAQVDLDAILIGLILERARQ